MMIRGYQCCGQARVVRTLSVSLTLMVLMHSQVLFQTSFILSPYQKIPYFVSPQVKFQSGLEELVF